MTETGFDTVPFPGLLADGILIVHAAVVAFVVGGQGYVMVGWARGWGSARNPGFRGVHLALVVFVVLQTWLGQLCPLTVWEAELRKAAGQSALDGSFVQHWLGRLLFFDLPWWVFQVTYTGFGLLVVASWVGYPPRFPRQD